MVSLNLPQVGILAGGDEVKHIMFIADLDGVTYYYPIPVNQAGYGLTEPDEETVSGISGNCVYSYGITVTRPGSLDPDTPLVPGTLELSLNVNAWDVIPHFDKVF